MRVLDGACVQPPDLRTVETCAKPACTNSPELRHMHSQHDTPRWDVGAWGPVRYYVFSFFFFFFNEGGSKKRVFRVASSRSKKKKNSLKLCQLRRNAFCALKLNDTWFYDFSVRRRVGWEFGIEQWLASRREVSVPRSINPNLRKCANPRLVLRTLVWSNERLGSTRNGRPR